MDGLNIPSRIEHLLPSISPLGACKTFYHLDLMSTVLKAQDCSAALFSTGMETIYYRFPLKAWLHSCTDDSELEMNGVADAGIYCEH
ncbi:hypothetical protein NPIL_425341 [Nephila pilipes]|uniref:Uncharacterized protein n=1 Tax=Nephila pilipes TaxID=299642 RepID=A0A8X6MLA9_NEPPI|nr:hypothetical protein NPIL_425341 [Nephila pilipes]